MPTLKQLNCQIEWAETNTAFQEYGTLYGDGIVETFIVVPEQPQLFTIRLTSTAFIWEGLTMVVFIDGKYQCNRNRVNLQHHEKDIPKNKTEVEFHLRQKEKPIGDGTYLGRDWRFDAHNIVSEIPEGVKESHFDLLGTIEVLVLRCQSRLSLERTLSTSSSGADSALHDTGGTEMCDNNSENTPSQAQKTTERTQDAHAAELNDAFGGLFANFDGTYDDFHHKEADSRGHWAWTWQPQDAYDARNGTKTWSHRSAPPAHHYGETRLPPPLLSNSHRNTSSGERDPRHDRHVRFGGGRPRGLSQSESSRERAGPRQSPREQYFRDYTDHVGLESGGRQPGDHPNWQRNISPPHARIVEPSSGHYMYEAEAKTYDDPPQHFYENVERPILPPKFPMLPAFRKAPAGPFPPLRQYMGPPPLPSGPMSYGAYPGAAFVPGMIPAYPPPNPYGPYPFHQGPGYFMQHPPGPSSVPKADSIRSDGVMRPNTTGLEPGKDVNPVSGEIGQDHGWDFQNPTGHNDTLFKTGAQEHWGASNDQTGVVSGGDDWDQNNAAPQPSNDWESKPADLAAGNDWSNDNQNDKWANNNPSNHNNNGDQNNTWANGNQNGGETANTAFEAPNNPIQNNTWESNWASTAATAQANISSTASVRPLHGPYGEYYSLKSSGPESVQADAEEEPRYDVPQSVVSSKGTTKQVQPGKGYVYSKKRCCPKYIDRFEAPYARFVFKYRTKEQLKNEINIDLETEPTGNKEVQDLQKMDKNELIELLLLAKGALGGKIPEIPPKSDSAALQDTEAVPIDPPDQKFLRYSLPPVRNVSGGFAGRTSGHGNADAYKTSNSGGNTNENSWSNNNDNTWGNEQWTSTKNHASSWDGAAEKDNTKQPTVVDAVDTSPKENAVEFPETTEQLQTQNEDSNPFQRSKVSPISGFDAPATIAANSTGSAFANYNSQPSMVETFPHQPTPTQPQPTNPASGQSGWNQW